MKKYVNPKFINAFPANPTQTAYRRFQKIPNSVLRSDFTDVFNDFNSSLKLKNPFDVNNGGKK